MSEFVPTMLNTPPNCGNNWWADVWAAWNCSKAGRVSQAFELYEYADSFLDGGELNASLSVLRHNDGIGWGTVRPIAPTEDIVVSMLLPRLRTPEVDAEHLVEEIPEANFERLMEQFPRHTHSTDRPHVMVMSTGRCGTMSLFKLFQGSNLAAYHSYWFKSHPYGTAETVARLAANEYDDMSAAEEWISTRTAEWLGDQPMIGLNHSDTAFAPVFAALHPKSKFIYLRRDPAKVAESFISKNQWSGGNNHFLPVLYDLPFKFAIPNINPAEGIEWHIEFTEKFSRAFGQIMGDRFIEISADKLFSQDPCEVSRLLEFTNSDISLDKAVQHFGTRINGKDHKRHD